MPFPSSAPDRWTVLKFGGSSVSSRARWDTIGTIAAARAAHSRVLIVVSALSGVTNMLQFIARDDEASLLRADALRERHRSFALEELGLEPDMLLQTRCNSVHDRFGDVRRRDHPLAWQAEILAQGELISSSLGAAYLRSRGLLVGWLDAREWLRALPLPHQSPWAGRLSVSCETTANAEWRERFDQIPSRICITQGFIAHHPEGGTAVLGRGGSDTSAACFGALLGADCVEIWTDVPGMFSADPREVPEARLLARLDYAEAQEIATTGAKVLHPRAIAPCREARVPLAILDTARPDLPGTRIEASGDAVPGVKAISRRNGIVLVSMESIGMWHQVGFLADVFERFRRHGLSVDLIGSSETNVTVSLDPSENLVTTDVLTRLSADLAEVCRVKVIAPCAAITLVGRGMRSLLHKLSAVWSAFGQERVHLISQSSNDLNLTFVIDESDADGLLAELHAALIDSGAMPVDDARVFGPSWRALAHGRVQRETPWWHGERDRLLHAAGQGTPRYVYHLPTLRQRARRLQAVEAIDRRYFAIKANPHAELLRVLAEEGFGLECVSLGELTHVFSVLPELDPARVLFTPSFAPHEEYQAALARGVTVTLDNVEALRNWPETFRGRTLWLRVDLGRGGGHHAKVVTGGAASKFGLPLTLIDEFLQQARDLQIRISGIHAHLGSGIVAPAHWREVYAELAGIADAIGTVECIDIGGGLPIAYKPDAPQFDLAAWAQGLAEIKTAYPRYALAIEPGRYLVAECGVLLARVTQVVDKQGIRRVGLDAGMHSLMRPALYDAWHGIHNLSRLQDDAAMRCDVVGPICESGDVLGTGRLLPEATREGDVMLIADAGAYGRVMANSYNLRALPQEDVLQ